MIAAQGQYDIPFTELEAKLQEWAAEALELRHGAGKDPDGALGPSLDTLDMLDSRAIYALLTRVRQRGDRVDGLLARTTQAKARARRAQAAAEYKRQLEFDEATNKNSGRVEFSTREERLAAANLDSLEFKRLAHFSERTTDIATEVHEIVSQVHWQLEGLRKDLREGLHRLAFESTLER